MRQFCKKQNKKKELSPDLHQIRLACPEPGNVVRLQDLKSDHIPTQCIISTTLVPFKAATAYEDNTDSVLDADSVHLTGRTEIL